MSIDRSYDSKDPQKTKDSAAKIYKKFKIDWRNAFDPQGWKGVERTFNAQGYGILLVDPKGVVRGAGLHARNLQPLLKQINPSP